MPRRRRVCGGREGVSVVAAVLTLAVLAVIAAVFFSLLAVESETSVSQAASAEAFFIADAGMEYAIMRLSSPWGVYAGEVNKAFSAGDFDVSVFVTDFDGSPLPPSRRRVLVVGRVPAGGTPRGERSIEALVRR